MRRSVILMLWLALTAIVQAAQSESEVARLKQAGIDALVRAQTDDSALLQAARAFTAAEKLLESTKGNEAEMQEINSFLFWCKKKMSLTQINEFVKSGAPDADLTVKKLEEVEAAKIPADEAQKYLDAAQKFSTDHPGEHLLNAIRFFEVANRFLGTEISMKAQERSLKEISQVKSETAQPATVPGTYSAELASEKFEMTLNADKTFTSTSKRAGGRWQFDGKELKVIWPFITPEILKPDANGNFSSMNGLKLRRPVIVPGEYSIVNPKWRTQSADLTLKPDGTLLKHKGTGGRWELKGDVLLLHWDNNIEQSVKPDGSGNFSNDEGVRMTRKSASVPK